MPSKAARDARLDALASAVKEWAKKRREYLNNQSSFAKRVLKGRPGQDHMSNVNVELASDLLVDEIGQFLAG
jgi:hypothetical protein